MAIMTMKNTVVALALAALSIMLQGCGCTTDNVTTCNKSLDGLGTDMSKICDSVKGWAQCIKDNSCCSEAGVGEQLTTLKTTYASIGCEIAGC